jgi:fido (protein-threonine AMPylation protein)
LAEYMEVIGYADAAQWVYGQGVEQGDWTTGRLLSLQEVRSVHHRVMTPVWNVAAHPHAYPSESPGNWREHEIEPFPKGMKAPSFTDIDALMRDWVDSVDHLRRPQEEPFPERLAGLHNAFERIHPFLDGNGRTGRLLLNLILARLGYPPAIIFKNERTKYLAAMRKADLSCPLWRVRLGSCRWPAWQTRRRDSAQPRCESRHTGAGCARRSNLTARGCPPASGWSSTRPTATGGSAGSDVGASESALSDARCRTELD